MSAGDAHDGCDVRVVSEPGKGLPVYRAPARPRRELIEVKMAAESGANLLHCKCRLLADFVAEVFCPSECVRLIQDQASMRNVDSRIHSLRFDCCVFLFYSFSAVTFATKSAYCDFTRPEAQAAG